MRCPFVAESYGDWRLRAADQRWIATLSPSKVAVFVPARPNGGKSVLMLPKSSLINSPIDPIYSLYSDLGIAGWEEHP